MPVVQVQLIKGYDEATRISLATRITRAVRATIAAPLESLVVCLNEVEPAGYMRGGRSGAVAAAVETGAGVRPGAARPKAGDIVRAYLAEMEARDLGAAGKRLAPGFEMVFPGGVRFREVAELVAWGSTRYQSVGKVIDQVEECWQDDHTVVWCYGTLFGTWPDGQAFEGIRFVDRFTVRDGLLVDQLVWNDLAESRKA
ncbi:MAG: tautomerase family protein [Burkholderiaceae bacterium]